ncbi:uncharacterized protein EV154DRAFT_555420 [Mucor mucedo]|uniref:uncharacterized protein n=1 Tax=Mucor mucedo TaxID=29922 RepID=UPI00221FEBEA|nr:uncharacterized protein EV154DRAFT_555420 [Mucor mucedo]KAI7879209.1 hypothetical protein EV154DRAFT_555420 [Mucor mucedo]
MHDSSIRTKQSKNDVLRVVLDEPRIYMEESLGSVMIRGEVIVHFLKDTPIQGPIELLFEGIQRFEIWPELMAGSLLCPPTETKLRVIKLSLPPPNSKGIMPSGIQRFPFEFPIPSTLPTTVYIPGRIEIFYQISATIRRSKTSEDHDFKNNLNLIDWVYRNSIKKDYVTCTPIRIVRSIKSVTSNSLTTTNDNQSSDVSFPAHLNTRDPMIEDPPQSPWIYGALNQNQGTLDEIHDQLVHSLSDRTSGNLDQHASMLDSVQGIRYKLSIDRTAIAIGTRIGVELMIEPTLAKATIKSAVLKVSESRKYVMKIPKKRSNYGLPYETKKTSECVRMLLKWAYGYPLKTDQIEGNLDDKNKSHQTSQPKDKYIYQRCSNDQSLVYSDPPQIGSTKEKSFSDLNKKPEMMLDLENGAHESSIPKPVSETCDFLNLKELNQEVNIGEYFSGRFVMPAPDCSNLLRPSMEHESITISHWVHLIVTIECNGKVFDLILETPARFLDCRVVSVDDECQTILPPPPSYKPGDGHLYQENIWSASTFWQQREAITNVSGWGSCMPCPCQFKKLKSIKDKNNLGSNGESIKSPNNGTYKDCPPNVLPEWGPPPCYSEN